MSYETLIVDQAGAIATITLNRPDARNALDFAMRRELLLALDEIEANPAARVVILTGYRRRRAGAGRAPQPRGAAARELPAADHRDGRRIRRRRRVEPGALLRPHRRLRPRDGLGELFCKIGLAVDGGGTWLLPRLVGMARAEELVFTGDIIDAGAGAEPRGQWRSGRRPRGRGALAGAGGRLRRPPRGRRRLLREAPAEVLGDLSARPRRRRGRARSTESPAAPADGAGRWSPAAAALAGARPPDPASTGASRW